MVVTNDTDSYFGMIRIITNSIEPFLVTVFFARRPQNQSATSRVTTQLGVAVLPISDQRVQGVRLLVNYNKLDLMVDLHTEADLGEGCVPVGGKLRFMVVKPSLPSNKLKGFLVAPKGLIVEKRFL